MYGYSVLVNQGNKLVAVNVADRNEAINNIAYIYRNYGNKFSSAKVVPTQHIDAVVEYQPDFRFLVA